jgi:RNA polymerase sigma-70 factor, ECF subfamily
VSNARKRQRFEALARPELDALLRTALRIVGRRAVAEEIVQEACFKAYANFDPDDEPAAFRPWLFRVAVNLSLDHLRRGRHEATHGHDADASLHAVPDRSLTGQPHVLAVGRDIGRALELALARLSPELRAVATLVLIEELSYADAAMALTITEDLVRSRLSRARHDLRQHLAAHGADLASGSAVVEAPVGMLTSLSKRGPQ